MRVSELPIYRYFEIPGYESNTASQRYGRYRTHGTARTQPVVRYFIFKAPVRLRDRDLVSPKFRVRYTCKCSAGEYRTLVVHWYLAEYLYPNLARYFVVPAGSVPDAIMLLVSVLFRSLSCRLELSSSWFLGPAHTLLRCFVPRFHVRYMWFEGAWHLFHMCCTCTFDVSFTWHLTKSVP